MLRKLSIAAAAALLLVSSGASAASINLGGSSLNGNTLLDLSTDGQLSFDLDLANFSTIALQVDLSAADQLAGTISWNAIFANLSALNLGSYFISIAGADITLVGDLTDTFQTPIAGLVTTPGSALISFPGAGEAAGFELGNPLGLTTTDWELSNFLGPSFSMNLTGSPVPEPASVLLLAVAAAALALRRRTAD
jgi:hypothetical protein